MVAEHDPAVERGARTTPGAQRLGQSLGDRCAAMGEIAEDHEPLGAEAVRKRAEPAKRLLACAEGRRRAGGAKRRGLAEVEVGDE
jgi:hypothetical protein